MSNINLYRSVPGLARNEHGPEHKVATNADASQHVQTPTLTFTVLPAVLDLSQSNLFRIAVNGMMMTTTMMMMRMMTGLSWTSSWSFSPSCPSPPSESPTGHDSSPPCSTFRNTPTQYTSFFCPLNNTRASSALLISTTQPSTRSDDDSAGCDSFPITYKYNITGIFSDVLSLP